MPPHPKVSANILYALGRLTPKEYERRKRLEGLIVCPHCKHEHEPPRFGLRRFGLTESGDGPPFKVRCQQCDHFFFVEEQVERTYKAYLPNEVDRDAEPVLSCVKLKSERNKK